MFNEGYNSLKADELIRHDLCAEAMRLCKLLTEHRVVADPPAFALLSLMCFQASRFESRIGEDNTIILLQKQDRNKWDHELIRMGYYYLNLSSEGRSAVCLSYRVGHCGRTLSRTQLRFHQLERPAPAL
ncbi:DUF6596 domain-containing protein [Puia sp. P3]|uniref:DUF6596 domain-containing protein n=1 Tax=Puia sp. P3 TaxID=3423952 RepID=UPI003D6643B9